MRPRAQTAGRPLLARRRPAKAYDLPAPAGRWGQDKAIYAPIWELAFLNGAGLRVQESSLGLISGHPYTAPYEGVTLKGK